MRKMYRIKPVNC